MDWIEMKFIISQQSEELRLQLTDWDWDVEGARTCSFSNIQRQFLSALEGKRINFIRKQGQFICNRCWKPKSCSHVRLVLRSHQLCLVAKILDMRVHSQ